MLSRPEHFRKKCSTFADTQCRKDFPYPKKSDNLKEKLLRQAILAAAWSELKRQDLSGDAAVEAWYTLRAKALEDAGFEPVWTEPANG